MYILMISRGIPSKQDPQWGCFEKDQAEALASKGHKVVVLSVDVRYKKSRGSLGVHHEIINGVEYYNHIAFPGIFFVKTLGYDFYINKIKFRYYRNLFEKIVKQHGKPDIIYSQFYWNTVMGVKLKEISGVPVVGIEHWSRFNESNLSKHDYKWASFAFEGVNALITVSKNLSNRILKTFNVKSFITPNILGDVFLRTNIVNKNKSIFKFISVGSLIERKGFDILIKAFHESGLFRENCILEIIGDGPEKEFLQGLIEQLNLNNQVKLLGSKTKSEIVESLQESNVFVLPSRSETFGVVFIEALACGLPCIATICGGPEYFINESNGILIDCEDLISLANSMKLIKNDYLIYDRINIRKDCIRQFSPESVGKQLIEIFINVINNDLGDKL